MEELVLYAVEYARNLGASYAEARYHRRELRSVTMRGDRIIGIGSRVSEGIGIRVLYEGSMAFAATGRLDREGVRSAVERAISNARSFSSLVKNRMSLSRERFGRASYEVRVLKPFENLAIGDRVPYLKDLYRAVQGSLREARLSTFIANYSEEIEEKIVINSDGAYIRSKIPRVEGFINIVISYPGRGSMSKWYEIAASKGLELLEEEIASNKISNMARNMEETLIRGVSPPKEKIDVVIGPELVGLMMHEGVGHPLEADRVLGREAAQAGESYVKPEMVGRARLGGRYANVIDDPTIPGSSGFYLYDDEGVPARPKILYREGVVTELLHNRETAARMGVNSNGSSRSMDYASEPIVRMSNTYLAPGDMEFEELIEDIELGVYIKNNMEWNIDDTRWQHRYIGLEAFMIEKGELGKPVRNPVLEITTGDFLSSIVGVDKNLEFFPGTCGKGEPSQGVPVWMGGPNVRISKIYLGVAPVE
ncbi:MAG: TldD/PmbA family protein [Sulfolobales archaeon]